MNKKPAAKRAPAKSPREPQDRPIVVPAPKAKPISQDTPDTSRNWWGESRARIDELGLDRLCMLILEGHSTSAIARELKVSKAAMSEWISSAPERSARVKEARRQSAESYAEKGEHVLMQATTAVEVARARELAQHYRWIAKTRNPAEYGDKLELGGELKVSDLNDADLDKQIARLAGALGVALPGADPAAVPAAHVAAHGTVG